MIRNVILMALVFFAVDALGQEIDQIGGEYKGKKRNGVRHGKGVATWENGVKYDGMWRYGVMEGKGTLSFEGNVYEGDFHNGMMHGRGKLVYADSSVYEGSFKNNQKSGFGTMTLPDGSKHTGMWKDDKSNGHGKHEWASGTEYIGDWKDNEMHGMGILIYSDGRIEQGKFENNKYVPCECDPTPTVEKAFEASSAVFVGKVVEVYSDSGEFDEIIMEIQQYWKGEYGYNRRVFVKAGYTSCDLIFYEDATYLVYAKGGRDGVYTASKCSRTVEFINTAWEVEELNKLVPCKDEKAIRPGFASNEADHVCGCDGVTYRNPSRANKAGITSWKAGKCEEEAK